MLGPRKKRRESGKSDSEASGTPSKASIAIQSVHLGSRSTGVIEIEPTSNIKVGNHILLCRLIRHQPEAGCFRLHMRLLVFVCVV